jgi:PAS domain S-box-containing protein
MKMGSPVRDFNDLSRENFKLRQLLNAAVPLCQIDKNHRIVIANDAFASLLGLKYGDIVGRRCRDVWKSHLCNTDKCLLRQILDGRKVFRYEFTKELNKCDSIICEITAVPYYDSSGKTDGIVQSVINVTRHKQREEIHRTLLDLPMDLSILISPEGKILNIGNSTAEMLNCLPEELLGEDFWNCLPPQLKGIRRDYLDDAVRFSTPVRFERYYNERWYDCFFYPLPDINGNISKVAIFSKDITDRKITQQKLKEANNRLKQERRALKEKNIALKQMISVIDDEKLSLGRTIQKNLDNTIIPIIRRLEKCLPQQNKEQIEHLKESLDNLLSPLIGKLERSFNKLTPRELEICKMINQRFSTKEIASVLNTSASTVKNQRKSIRKKLSIKGKKVNLCTVLSRLTDS